MRIVKISFFLKLLVFIVNLLLLFIVIIIPQNIFGLSNIIPILVLFINFILFFYVLKNNKLTIKLFGLLLIILAIIFYIFCFYNILFYGLSLYYIRYFILIPYTFFLIIILLNLYFFNKNINKGTENLNVKLLTEKKQYIGFFISIIVMLIFLFVFRFGYYTKQNDFNNVDNTFFITKYQNVKIDDEDNLYYILKNFKYKESKTKYIKEEILKCLYNDKCYGTLSDYELNLNRINDDEVGQFKFVNKNEILDKKERLTIKLYLKKNINVLYNFENNDLTNNLIENMINDFSKKKYYKSNIDENIVLTNFIGFNRDLKYKVLYYMNKNNETKAIEILQSQINMLYTILNGDSSGNEFFVSLNCLNMGFENIDLLLKNYKLSISSKKILLSLLNREINKKSLDNSLKNDYKSALKTLEKLPRENTTFYNYDYTKKLFDEITYNKINNNGVVSNDILYKYTKLNFLKSNIIGKIILSGNIETSYQNQYKKLFDLNDFRRNLILKILNN